MNPPTNQSISPAIEMRGVAAGSLNHPETLVVENVEWTVNVGEFWLVAGAQRAGKSDFLMMTGGIMPPVRGTYHLLGQEMPIYEDARIKERLRLGFVFDSGQLFSQMTIAENIALPLRYHHDLTFDEAMERVGKLLDLMELSSVADRTPITVGRNWNKRAALARALVLEPEVLLLDNPLGGLDARHANWWLEFLDRWSRGDSNVTSKRTTLVATVDDLRPWRQHAGRFAYLREKRFVALGDWQAVENSREPLILDLLHTRSLPNGDGKKMEAKK